MKIKKIFFASALIFFAAVSSAKELSLNDINDIKKAVEFIKPWVQNHEPNYYRVVFLGAREVRKLCENELGIRQRLMSEHRPIAVSPGSNVAVRYISPAVAHQILQDEAANDALRVTIPNKVHKIIDQEVRPFLPGQMVIEMTLSPTYLQFFDREHLLDHTQEFFTELKKSVNAGTADYAKCVGLIDTIGLGAN